MSSSIVRARWAPIVAVTLGVLVIGAAPAHVSLDLLTHQLRGGEDVTVDWITAVGFSVPAAVTGAVVAARRPGNPLGWLLLALFLLGGAPTADYAFLDFGIHHGTLPLGWAAVALAGAWPVWLFLIALLLWLFPDGRLPRARWRRVSVALVSTGAVLGVVASVGNFVAVRLRLTVDLDEVQGDLVGAVDTAFQPAHVSVWLPPRLRPGCRGR